MYTSGQMIKFDKYQEALHRLPAPILGGQLPNVQIDITALLEYARKKGIKAGDLSEDEKNQFIVGGTVESLRKKVSEISPYKNLAEWNAANG